MSIVASAPQWGQKLLQQVRAESQAVKTLPPSANYDNAADIKLDHVLGEMVEIAKLDEGLFDEAPGQPGVVVNRGRKLSFEGDPSRLDLDRGERFEAVQQFDAPESEGETRDFLYGYIADSATESSHDQARGYCSVQKNLDGALVFGAESRERATGTKPFVFIHNDSWYVSQDVPLNSPLLAG